MQVSRRTVLGVLFLVFQIVPLDHILDIIVTYQATMTSIPHMHNAWITPLYHYIADSLPTILPTTPFLPFVFANTQIDQDTPRVVVLYILQEWKALGNTTLQMHN